MTTVTEIAPKLYRIATYLPQPDLQFCQFVVDDDEPLLYHTGLRQMFPAVRAAVASVIDPARLRWIGFSHYEADECGALNDWLAIAPHAEPFCTLVGALTSVNDFAVRPARVMQHGESLATGQRRFRFLQTPHVPHCWDASLLFEETQGVLFSSDLLHQNGDVAPSTESDVVAQTAQALRTYQASPFANMLAYTANTERIMQELASLQPRTIATMHGSTYVGDGERALRDLAGVLREVFGPAAG